MPNDAGADYAELSQMGWTCQQEVLHFCTCNKHVTQCITALNHSFLPLFLQLCFDFADVAINSGINLLGSDDYSHASSLL